MPGWRELAQPVGSGAEAPLEEPQRMSYGAPGSVRLAVGSARDRDRLATLQRFYPDAKPYGQDNFVYTDPDSGTATLYNPPGLDVGDLPSITRDAVTGLGGAAGATAGAPLGIGGSLAGGTLGATAASRGVDALIAALGLPQAATPGEVAKDTTADLLSNLGGEAAGMAVQAVPGAIRRAIVRPDAARVADAAQAIGVRPTVGMVAQGPVASTENMAARVLPASRAAREQARFAGEIERAATGAVPGAPLTAAEGQAAGGAALKQGAQNAYGRFRAARQRLDDSVYASFPQGATVQTGGLSRVADDLRQRIAEAPETFGPALAPVLQRIDGVLSDAGRYGNRLPLQVQRNVRTLIGQELEGDATTALTPEAQRWFRRAYSSLTDDLRGAAAAQSPQALRNLNRHDRLVRAFRGEDAGRESVADSLDKILRAGSDESAYSALFSTSGGINRMQNVLNRLDEPQRRIVARAAWDNLLTTPSGNMNLNRLAGQWNRMNPAARRQLFGRVADMGDLESLMTVIGGMREADRSRNFSNTGYTLIQAALGDRAVSEVMTKVGALVTGGAAAGSMFPTETLGTLGSAYLLSEAIHSPAMMRALVQTARGGTPEMTETVRRSVGRAVGRMTSEEWLTDDQDARSNSANVSRNSSPAAGWRTMIESP